MHQRFIMKGFNEKLNHAIVQLFFFYHLFLEFAYLVVYLVVHVFENLE